MGNQGPQFPFRVTRGVSRAAVEHRVNQALQNVDRMVWDMTRQFNYLHLGFHALEDIHSKCMVHLWEKALPQYDAWHVPKTRPSTFAHDCARRFIISEFRSHCRHLRSAPESVMDPDVFTSMPAPDERLDTAVERQARNIIRNPERYLSPAQCNVLRTFLKNPGMAKRQLATTAGYQLPSSISTVLHKIRDILNEVDIEDYAVARPRKRTARLAARPVVPQEENATQGLSPRGIAGLGGPAPEARAAA